MSLQLSFFDEPVRRARAPGRPADAPRDKPTGRYLAEQVAALAAEKAERDNEGWQVAALSFFIAFARNTAPGSTFATEDVRHASAGKVPAPTNARAWGSIAKRARALKQVEWAGFAPTSDPRSHGCPRSAWRFVGERSA